MTATGAVILGTIAGLVLARFGPFRGRALLSGLTTAPLVMPDVITGISLLIFFILLKEYIGWPAQRGVTTVTLAHITFSLTYVTTIIQSRLSQADLAIEEAAMDLGSRPLAGHARHYTADHSARDPVGLASGFYSLA